MEGGHPNAGAGRDDKAPGLDESVRALNSARRQAVDASRGTGRALRRLIAADFAHTFTRLARLAHLQGAGKLDETMRRVSEFV